MSLLSGVEPAHISSFIVSVCVCVCLWQPNKGAVAIRFDLLGINIIFVNVHMQAHQAETASRIIVSKARFSKQHVI
jgi:hypothetical protein